MSQLQGTLPEVWAPRKYSITFWLLAFLNAGSLVTTLLGTFDLARATLLKQSSELEMGLGFLIVAGLLFFVQAVLWWAVRTFYSRQIPILARTAVFIVYLVCLLITAGFGFGFWWKIIYGNQETMASVRLSVESTEISLNNAVGRLESLKITLRNLQEYSARQAEVEETKGNTCGTSAPNPGPRQRLRKQDAEFLKGISVYVDSKRDGLNAQITKIKNDFDKSAKSDVDTNRSVSDSTQYIETLNSELNVAIQGFNNFTADPVLVSYKSALRTRADQVDFAEGSLKFKCPDTLLSASLTEAATAIEGLPKLTPTKILISQGSRAVAQALGRLKNTVAVAVLDCQFFLRPCALPPSASEIRNQYRMSGTSSTRIVTEDEAGIDRNEIVPLALGLFVDAAILGIGYFRYRRDIVPENTDKFLKILDRTFQTAFNRLPNESERLLPIKAATFHHWSGHYAAVPLDFNKYQSVQHRDRKTPAWARRADEGRQGPDAKNENVVDRHPTFLESQYLDNALVAFSNLALAKPLGLIGRVVMSEQTAQNCLARQNSFFANAPAFKLFKFYPNAWNVVMMHFVMGGYDASSNRTVDRGFSRSGPDQGPFDDSQRRGNHFPKGFSHET